MVNLLNFWWLINLLLIIIALRVNCNQTECSPYANTTLSRFTGLILTVNDSDTNRIFHVKAFYAISYAKRPKFDLRYRKPVPITVLNANLQKKYFRNACKQLKVSPFPWALSYTFDADHINEDCLELNIWAPCNANPQNKKSVFFWIHGGGFTTGSASRLKIYRGDVLAALGDVVVVTINYRLGIRGFWTNNTPDAPGNLAIWDVIQALRWVKENIEAFGGDKDSVTIAGQDAGAVIVSLLAVTPHAKGLFKRQIVQSGSAMWTLMNDQSASSHLSQKVAEIFGCANKTYKVLDHPNETAQCMRTGVPFDKFYTASQNATLPKNHRVLRLDSLYTSFIPRWGDELFPSNPRELLLKGGFPFTDLLIGNTAREGTFLLTTGMPEYLGFFGNESSNLSTFDAKHLMESLFYTYKGKSDANMLCVTKLHKYFSDDDEDETAPYGVDVDNRWLLADAIGGYLFVCPTVFYAASSRRSGAKVYYYDFRYRSPNYGPWALWMRPTHFDEVKYIFGIPLQLTFEYEAENPKSFVTETYGTSTVEERRISRMMIKHWSNFVKYGKPDDDWPIYGKRSERFVYIDDRQPVKAYGPHGYNCKEWWNYIYPNVSSILPDYKDS